MPRIIFWSPESSMTGNTHAILAVTTLMGINHKAKSLLMQGHFNSRKIETSFTPYDELKSSGVFENSDIGIGALTKIVVSNKLTASTIKNYAKPVLKDRLDVLYGINSSEKEQYTLMAHNLQFITRKAAEIYDLVFVDLPKQNNEEYVKQTLMDSEVIVCTVNQDSVKLEEFFASVQKNELLKGKSIIYVIGDYENKSKYNIRNIKTKYGIKDAMFAIPHNYAFVDACNDGSVIDFFYKNMNADKTDYNGEFISEVSKIVEKIIEESKIKDF
jgi:MinD-like ATPase involved in chromosome partitioning or flagellar assembly